MLRTVSVPECAIKRGREYGTDRKNSAFHLCSWKISRWINVRMWLPWRLGLELQIQSVVTPRPLIACDHRISTLKAPQEIKPKQEDDAIISKGDKCIWLKTIRGRDVSRSERSLYPPLSLFFFHTYLHSLGWLAVHWYPGRWSRSAAKTQTCRREKVTSEAYHSNRRE